MVREIIIWPDPVLSRKCEEVKDLADPVLKQLLDDMEQTMLHAKGAGLAAPQVGFALRAVTVLARRPDGASEVLRLVNPRIVDRRGSIMLREGCLSLPGYFDMVRRSEWVKVEAQDETGARVDVEGDGVLAHVLQHELEHLEGKVFVDHLSPLKRNTTRRRFEKAKGRGMRYRAEVPAPRDFTQP